MIYFIFFSPLLPFCFRLEKQSEGGAVAAGRAARSARSRGFVRGQRKGPEGCAEPAPSPVPPLLPEARGGRADAVGFRDSHGDGRKPREGGSGRRRARGSGFPGAPFRAPSPPGPLSTLTFGARWFGETPSEGISLRGAGKERSGDVALRGDKERGGGGRARRVLGSPPGSLRGRLVLRCLPQLGCK